MRHDKKTSTLLLALYALLAIAGVAVNELVHHWIGIAMTFGASCLIMFTVGQRYGIAADEEREKLEKKLRRLGEICAEIKKREK